MDPILEYLLEFNTTNPIEYKGRYLIPVGGLAKMLNDFKGFHLNTEVVVKPEIGATPTQELNFTQATEEELYNLLG